jgi:ligand-binding SRPBCC domain-containing protein
MATFKVVTTIAAPIEVCFDLARDIDLHIRSQAASGERAVAGRTSGLIELDETVTWEARHLGVRQQFTSRITAMERPRHFRDEMMRGAFRTFAHDHGFQEQGGVTVMTDDVVFRSPLGLLGRVVDAVFMTGYLRRLIAARGEVIRREAETGNGSRAGGPNGPAPSAGRA